ncbi:MAG: DUF2752 domain-containing protein [Bacteroidaceae bacterium]|nr:DUF2752 domain-containing protein [Bacteroidaceae bacterium]
MKKLESTLLFLLMAGVAVLIASPVGERFMLPCPLNRLTGLQCPFCGGQRMLRHILHFEISEAFKCNPVLFCLLPFVVVWCLCIISPKFANFCRRFNITEVLGKKILLLLLLIIILWGVIRNVNFFY